MNFLSEILFWVATFCAALGLGASWAVARVAREFDETDGWFVR